jgi:hypothetical protein
MALAPVSSPLPSAGFVLSGVVFLSERVDDAANQIARHKILLSICPRRQLSVEVGLGPKFAETFEMSHSKEWLHGLKESAAGIETLRSLWPVAFPKKSHLVKPLVSSIIPQIVERTGWSTSYTKGVLHAWKQRSAYCFAVLQNERRCNPNGEELADTVIDDSAREQARRQLATIAASRLKAEEKRAAKAPTGISPAVA